MGASGAAILANPQPREHIVYTYKDDSKLIEVVSLFATTGFKR
jgi:hypothetical protein